MKEIKIRILDQDHCREVQNAFFEKKCGWSGSITDIKYLHSKWIFCNEDELLTYSDNISYGSKHSYKEITLQELLNKNGAHYEIY